MSFCQFLSQGWSAERLAIIVGVIVAIVIEYWPAYQDLPAKWKQLVFAGICLVWAFASWGIALWQGCPDVPDWWIVLQAVIAAAGLAFGAGTLIHRLIVALGLGYKPKEAGQ